MDKNMCGVRLRDCSRYNQIRLRLQRAFIFVIIRLSKAQQLTTTDVLPFVTSPIAFY